MPLLLPSIFAASALPIEYDSPSPKEPPQNSTPGHFRSGCPCNLLPNFLSVSISEGSKYPATARLEKRPGDACPFERINLSRSSQRGFFGSNRRYLLKRQPIISAFDYKFTGLENILFNFIVI